MKHIASILFATIEITLSLTLITFLTTFGYSLTTEAFNAFRAVLPMDHLFSIYLKTTILANELAIESHSCSNGDSDEPPYCYDTFIVNGMFAQCSNNPIPLERDLKRVPEWIKHMDGISITHITKSIPLKSFTIYRHTITSYCTGSVNVDVADVISSIICTLLGIVLLICGLFVSWWFVGILKDRLTGEIF